MQTTSWDIGYVNEDGLFSCGGLRQGYPGYEARLVDEWDQPGARRRGRRAHHTRLGPLDHECRLSERSGRNGRRLAEWLVSHTGDAFSMDPRRADLYFRDRIKDCIRRRGENVSSFEVEEAIRKHPAIADCAAVAVETEQTKPGADEEIKVVVVRAAGADLDPADLIRWMIPNTPRFMIPRYVEFVDELPRTPTLKVRKAALRAPTSGARRMG